MAREFQIMRLKDSEKKLLSDPWFELKTNSKRVYNQVSKTIVPTQSKNKDSNKFQQQNVAQQRLTPETFGSTGRCSTAWHSGLSCWLNLDKVSKISSLTDYKFLEVWGRFINTPMYTYCTDLLLVSLSTIVSLLFVGNSFSSLSLVS